MTSIKTKPLDCLIKKPVPLRVGDFSPGSVEIKSGCCVVDVLFPGMSTVDIGEISLKNNYTASLTIKAKVLDPSGSNEVWKTCARACLMPHPHYENGSQDYFTFTRNEMELPLSGVVMLRLILKQPSPHWNSFGIEELKCLPSNAKSSTTSPSLWLTLEGNKETASNTLQTNNQGLPNVEEVAASLQQLWAMTEELKTADREITLGRFDVDGSYDINLLSYT